MTTRSSWRCDRSPKRCRLPAAALFADALNDAIWIAAPAGSDFPDLLGVTNSSDHGGIAVAGYRWPEPGIQAC